MNSVYDRVLMALLASTGNPCTNVSEALRAAADFAVTERTHRGAAAFGVDALRSYEVSDAEGCKSEGA